MRDSGETENDMEKKGQCMQAFHVMGKTTFEFQMELWDPFEGPHIHVG